MGWGTQSSDKNGQCCLPFMTSNVHWTVLLTWASPGSTIQRAWKRHLPIIQTLWTQEKSPRPGGRGRQSVGAAGWGGCCWVFPVLHLQCAPGVTGFSPPRTTVGTATCWWELWPRGSKEKRAPVWFQGSRQYFQGLEMEPTMVNPE